MKCDEKVDKQIQYTSGRDSDRRSGRADTIDPVCRLRRAVTFDIAIAAKVFTRALRFAVAMRGIILGSYWLCRSTPGWKRPTVTGKRLELEASLLPLPTRRAGSIECS